MTKMTAKDMTVSINFDDENITTADIVSLYLESDSDDVVRINATSIYSKDIEIRYKGKIVKNAWALEMHKQPLIHNTEDDEVVGPFLLEKDEQLTLKKLLDR